jgi:hypothetical protein
VSYQLGSFVRLSCYGQDVPTAQSASPGFFSRSALTLAFACVDRSDSAGRWLHCRISQARPREALLETRIDCTLASALLSFPLRPGTWRYIQSGFQHVHCDVDIVLPHLILR